MSHSFAPVPTNYVYHRPGLWACRHCGLFTDNQGADVIKAYPDCASFERAIRQSNGTGTNPYAPGQRDYPFAQGAWGKAPAPQQAGTWIAGGGGGSISGGVCGAGTLDPALTASGLPIRNPQPESGYKFPKAPPAKHVAGIDHEEIDWSAHKEFMKGM